MLAAPAAVPSLEKVGKICAGLVNGQLYCIGCCWGCYGVSSRLSMTGSTRPFLPTTPEQVLNLTCQVRQVMSDLRIAAENNNGLSPVMRWKHSTLHMLRPNCSRHIGRMHICMRGDGLTTSAYTPLPESQAREAIRFSSPSRLRGDVGLKHTFTQ